MCGIVATIGYTKEDVNEMLEIISHRGRDNRGIMEFQYNDKNIILGHNRLSINDTSPLGNQPMEYEGVQLVVNGEIWNYPQLRKEYEERGYTFKSNSDSEIILFLYKENELKRLSGMFSFVIYDKNKLILSRDWVGKLPLYIFNNGTYIIASELKSIINTHKGADIKFVPKNSLVEINLDTNKIDVHSNYYFNFSNDITNLPTREEVGKKTYQLLRDAVDKRLLSDVPIATSLSGGIDSAVITYLLSTKIPNLKAYTIAFDQSSPDLQKARVCAKHLGVELVEVFVPRDEELLKQRFIDSIRVIEYPSTVQMEVGILQSFIAEQMAKDGIKVAFSGEGSDESYGSYGMIRMFSKKPDWSDIRKKLFEKQYYGNLLRGNTIFMNYGTIELRCPFFDTDFLDFTTNLTDEFLSKGSQWKLPLADAFRPYLPEEIIEQEKRAFQKGTNFKQYIEELILNDSNINFRNRKNMLHVIGDNFEKINGFSHKKMKAELTSTNMGIYQWI
jgi:asparagine synthase (glutamine-hydrolysing)